MRLTDDAGGATPPEFEEHEASSVTVAEGRGGDAEPTGRHANGVAPVIAFHNPWTGPPASYSIEETDRGILILSLLTRGIHVGGAFGSSDMREAFERLGREHVEAYEVG